MTWCDIAFDRINRIWWPVPLESLKDCKFIIRVFVSSFRDVYQFPDQEILDWYVAAYNLRRSKHVLLEETKYTLKQTTHCLSHNNIASFVICSGYNTQTAPVFISTADVLLYISLYKCHKYIYKRPIYHFIILSSPILVSVGYRSY